MNDMAEACWEAIDDALPREKAILAGCSVGSSLAPHMYHLRPDKTAALVFMRDRATIRIRNSPKEGLPTTRPTASTTAGPTRSKT
jgi:pimeloyl-ACP methyl ester carboxylesterase